jgi:hypothetical protein
LNRREQQSQDSPQGYRNTVIAASCLGLVWFGDTVIYIVLPLYASTFGFDAFTVGVLLSINRVVRIIGYGWVAPLARTYGSNILTAAACAAGALSTLAYGLLSGFVLLFIARMVWGAAWGIINLTMTAYAYGDGRTAGTRIGVARAVCSVGALAALVAVGPLCLAVGPHQTFVLFGLLGLLAIPLAFLLPPLRAAPGDGQAARRWTLTPFNALFFVISFGADGVLGATVAVLLAEFMPVASAITGAAALLALQRVVIIVLALFSGPLTDRLGAERLLLPCSLAVAAGLATIATGHVYFGTIVVIVSRALLATVGPVLAAQKSMDRIAALASFATWTDVGLAAGAFFGLVGIVEIGYATSYGLLAVLSVAVVLWYSRSVKPV